ncbi:MAG TPA: lipocalin family protein [Myxococcota bacterium]|nr:lipocalin family protein [Myxococcota bacterium]
MDLRSFIGDWYVIAHIPAWLEKDAHKAVESYRLEADGSIATTTQSAMMASWRDEDVSADGLRARRGSLLDLVHAVRVALRS